MTVIRIISDIHHRHEALYFRYTAVDFTDIGRFAEGCRRQLSAAFLGILTISFAHARRSRACA